MEKEICNITMDLRVRKALTVDRYDELIYEYKQTLDALYGPKVGFVINPETRDFIADCIKKEIAYMKAKRNRLIKEEN